VAINSRLPLLNQRKSSVLPFGAAYVEDAELVRVGQSMGSTAAAACTKPQFSLPAAQVIQLTQVQTVQQTAYKRKTLFNNSANGTTVVTQTAATT